MDQQIKLRIYLLQQQRRLTLSDAQIARRGRALLSVEQFRALLAGTYQCNLRLTELVGLALILQIPLAEVLEISGWFRLKTTNTEDSPA